MSWPIRARNEVSARLSKFEAVSYDMARCELRAAPKDWLEGHLVKTWRAEVHRTLRAMLPIAERCLEGGCGNRAVEERDLVGGLVTIKVKLCRWHASRQEGPIAASRTRRRAS